MTAPSLLDRAAAELRQRFALLNGGDQRTFESLPEFNRDQWRECAIAVARVILEEPASEGMENARATLPEDDDTNWRKVASKDWRVLADARLADLSPRKA